MMLLIIGHSVKQRLLEDQSLHTGTDFDHRAHEFLLVTIDPAVTHVWEGRGSDGTFNDKNYQNNLSKIPEQHADDKMEELWQK